MAADDGYEALIEELVAAIELRETGDVDGVDATLDTRIRRLECELMTAHRMRPGRWRTADALLDRLAGRRIAAGRPPIGATRPTSG